jgi:hypothetical protein
MENNITISEYYFNYRRHNHLKAFYKNRPVKSVTPSSDYRYFHVKVVDGEGREWLPARADDYVRVTS